MNVASIVGYIGVSMVGVGDNLGFGFQEWIITNLDNHLQCHEFNAYRKPLAGSVGE